jgi:hypothetical protein
MAAWKAAEPGLRAFAKAYKTSLIGDFGEGNPELADFGIAVKVKATPSVETKAVALAERRKTVAARGPTGKARQAVTTQGKAGLALVSPTGQVIPGALAGPTPPGTGTPATVNGATVVGGGTPPANGAAPSAPTTSNGTGSTPTSNGVGGNGVSGS